MVRLIVVKMTIAKIVIIKILLLLLKVMKLKIIVISLIPGWVGILPVCLVSEGKGGMEDGGWIIYYLLKLIR